MRAVVGQDAAVVLICWANARPRVSLYQGQCQVANNWRRKTHHVAKESHAMQAGAGDHSREGAKIAVLVEAC